MKLKTKQWKIKNKNYFYVFLGVILIIFILFFANQKNENNLNQNVEKTIINIPIDVYIIKYNNNELSSTRDEENINEIFENVNGLWKQANIKADIKKIEEIIIKDSNLYYDLNDLLAYLTRIEKYDPQRINAYFAKSLQGRNGIVFPGNIIMVADVTSVYDFRATSHEIGHVLGLSHVPPTTRLMARGVNGFDLIEQEINTARSNAARLFQE